MWKLNLHPYKIYIRYSLWGLSILLLGAGLYPSFQKKINPYLENIHVSGQFTYLNTDIIKQSIQPMLDKRFFDLNLIQLKQYFLQIPWIQYIHIQKKWPNQLYITLQEQNPTAIWNQTAFFNDIGEVFEVSNAVSICKKKLPYLQGDKQNGYFIWSQFQWLQNQLKDLPLSIQYFSIDSTGAWISQIDHVTIHWGENHPKKQVILFQLLYHQVLSKKWMKVKYLDFRYPKGAAVHF
ncbi:MAG: FtsQ-type POTRA domain-containing protein [Endozoicomonadaceae bacterium]|nr:FtsQ-type POTRA domain-containing protein [Endozoicomonadaceae bacterium]MBE8232680.1 FtsQ-type POTRA domain-containing protein [Endozoicomonadaceae bacterium]